VEVRSEAEEEGSEADSGTATAGAEGTAAKMVRGDGVAATAGDGAVAGAAREGEAAVAVETMRRRPRLTIAPALARRPRRRGGGELSPGGRGPGGGDGSGEWGGGGEVRLGRRRLAREPRGTERMGGRMGGRLSKTGE